MSGIHYLLRITFKYNIPFFNLSDTIIIFLFSLLLKAVWKGFNYYNYKYSGQQPLHSGQTYTIHLDCIDKHRKWYNLIKHYVLFK